SGSRGRTASMLELKRFVLGASALRGKKKPRPEPRLVVRATCARRVYPPRRRWQSWNTHGATGTASLAITAESRSSLTASHALSRQEMMRSNVTTLPRSPAPSQFEAPARLTGCATRAAENHTLSPRAATEPDECRAGYRSG